MESVHPLVVHFPIALLLTAIALELLAGLTHRPWLRRVGRWNLCLGTVGAAIAVLTGLQAEESAKHSFEIWQVMQLHERLGISTLILGLMGSGVHLATRNRVTRGSLLIVWLIMACLVVTISWGAFLGGRLVYEFGVGGLFGTER